MEKLKKKAQIFILRQNRGAKKLHFMGSGGKEGVGFYFST